MPCYFPLPWLRRLLLLPMVLLCLAAPGCSFALWKTPRIAWEDYEHTGDEPETNSDQTPQSPPSRRTPVPSTAPAATTASPAIATPAESTKTETDLYRSVLAQNSWSRNHVVTSGENRYDKKRMTAALERQPDNHYALLNNLKGSDTVDRNRSNFSASVLSPHRWYHHTLDRIEKTLLAEISAAPETAPRLLAPLLTLLDDADPLVGVNAAILLVHLNAFEQVRSATDAIVRETELSTSLESAVRNKNLPMPVRCAAAEALGSLAAFETSRLVATLPLVEPKAAASQEKTPRQYDPNAAALYAELLCALADRLPPWEEDAFRHALNHPAKEVRIEVIAAWRRYASLAESLETQPPIALPQELLNMADRETDPAVYGELLLTLAAWRHSEAMRYLRISMRNQYAPVKLVALDALGMHGGEEAIALLRETLNNPAARLRARAVRSLRALEQYDAIFHARIAEDKSQEVRVEVAAALADRQTPRTRDILNRYWHDQSAQVLKATTEITAAWPLDIVGPMLLEMMGRQSFTQRAAAADALAQRWPPAADFDVKDVPEKREAALQALVADFERQHAVIADAGVPSSRQQTMTQARRPSESILDEVQHLLEIIASAQTLPQERGRAMSRLSSVADHLPNTLELLRTERGITVPESVYREVLALNDPVFENLLSLESGDIHRRRRAAAALQERRDRLDPLVSHRLAEIALQENDPMVIGMLFEVLSHGNDDDLQRLAVAFRKHLHAEVRKNAYRRLAVQKDSVTLLLLLDGFHDTGTDVIQTVLEELNRFPTKELASAREELVTPLDRLLRSSSPTIQLDAALLLGRLGDESARETVERLAISNDDAVRLQVATRLSEQSGTEFLPEMLRFLDDNGSIRRVALMALPRMVGRDIGAPPAGGDRSSQARVDRWKNWALHGRNTDNTD